MYNEMTGQASQGAKGQKMCFILRHSMSRALWSAAANRTVFSRAASPKVTPWASASSSRMATRRSRKKQLSSSATCLAFSCHSSRSLALFSRSSSRARPSMHLPNRVHQVLLKWNTSAASSAPSSMPPRAVAIDAARRIEGSGPASSAARRVNAIHREPSSASSNVSRASFPLNVCVCTSWAYMRSWFTTASACIGRAAASTPSTRWRSSRPASTKSRDSSSSGTCSRAPHCRTSCEALGTTCK
mmetsp:Transcript_15522/g.39987  ORF Transcript_15522/g.39987 Transcript_15522/m.39987 type:complete len:244 (+) Transcript_15522:891-1622(+)